MNIHKRGDLDRNDNGTRKKSLVRVLEKVVITMITKLCTPIESNREIIIQIRVRF